MSKTNISKFDIFFQRKFCDFMEDKPKREVPSALKKILDLDIKLSKDLVERVNQRYPIASYRYLVHLNSVVCRL